MITPEQVPENVWVQVALRLESVGCLIPDNVAKLIVAEAINAWQGMEQDQLFHGFTDGTHYFQPRIILPLTEASDGNTLVDTISDEVWRHDSSGDNCCATDPQEASDDEDTTISPEAEGWLP